MPASTNPTWPWATWICVSKSDAQRAGTAQYRTRRGRPRSPLRSRRLHSGWKGWPRPAPTGSSGKNPFAESDFGRFFLFLSQREPAAVQLGHDGFN